MGTRHLIAIKKGGKYSVAQYGQWDGYIGGQGLDILIFISDKNRLEKLKKNVDDLRWITDVECEELNKMGEKCFKEYPYLSRDCGAKILEWVVSGNVKFLRNSLYFAHQSLFCEWAYVIDFDMNTFEIYKGFNKFELNESERFYNGDVADNSGYRSVVHFKTYQLDDLPAREDFVKLGY